MMRLLFTSWYTGLGGGETDLLALAQGLVPHGVQPHLLLPHEGQLGQVWRDHGWHVHMIPFRGATTYFIPKLWERFPVVRRMASLLRSEQIGMVHSDYHSLPLIARAAKGLAVPLMWTVHGWWFHPKPWQRDFFRAIPIVARSMAIRDGFLGVPPFMPPDRVPVIYSGVDIQRFHPHVEALGLRDEIGIPRTVPLVAMVARFQRVKGHHTFQAMARRVLAQMPETHFVVAGESVFGVSAESAYKQQILSAAQADDQLHTRLHYIGFRHDVERILCAADVVVCPSEFESYGKVNLEAMSCGRPVISTNRGGPNETVRHGETGYLVAPDDVSTMADHVVRLLGDAAERQRLGLAGRHHIEALFSQERTTAAYWSWIQRLSGAAPKRAV